MRRAVLIITFFLTAYCYGQNSSSVIQLRDTSGLIYKIVEHEPEFPGGLIGLLTFLQKNFQYPEMQKENEICGKVVLKFIVDTDGAVIKPEVVRSCGVQIDKELIRVLALLPKFKPAYQDGKAVKYSFYLPINDFFGR